MNFTRNIFSIKGCMDKKKEDTRFTLFNIFLFLFMDCFVLQISEKYLSFIIFLCNRKQIPNIPRILFYDFESIFSIFQSSNLQV